MLTALTTSKCVYSTGWDLIELKMNETLLCMVHVIVICGPLIWILWFLVSLNRYLHFRATKRYGTKIYCNAM